MTREFKTEIDAPSVTIGTALSDVSLETHNHDGKGQTSLQIVSRAYTAPTITAPAGATQIVSLLLIAGGGAGGGGADGYNLPAAGGGGGAGGGMVLVNNIPVEPGETFTCSIGAGGNRSNSAANATAASTTASGNAGSDGADTTFTVRGTVYTAKGGGGGGGGGASGSPGTAGAGTLGTATGSALNFTPTGLVIAGASGGAGGDGDNNPVAAAGSNAATTSFLWDASTQFIGTALSGYGGGGGGGGGASSSASGYSAASGGNGGGASGGNGAITTSTALTGSTALVYGAGGGGGGAYSGTARSGALGGGGADGCIFILWDSYVDSWQTINPSTSGTKTLNDIEYNPNNGLMTIVGNAGFLATSTDGINWITQTSNTADDIMSIKYSNNENLWAAAVSTKRVLTSTNATSWTNTLISTSVTSVLSDFKTIHYSESSDLWVMLGTTLFSGATNPKYLVSTSATTGWASKTLFSAGENNESNIIKVNQDEQNNLWIFACDTQYVTDSYIRRTSDITTVVSGRIVSTAITTSGLNGEVTSIVRDGDPPIWIMTARDSGSGTGSTTNVISTSSDGITWTARTAAVTVLSSGGLARYGYAALSSAYSSYHDTWVISHSSSNGAAGTIGSNPGGIATSSDNGTTWVNSGPEKNVNNSLQYNNNQYNNTAQAGDNIKINKILWNPNLKKWIGISDNYFHYISDIT